MVSDEERKATSKTWRLANRDKVNASGRRYKAKYPERVKAKNRAWWAANKEKDSATRLRWRVANLARIMWKDAQKRAVRFNLEWDLELFDIHIPKVCPVLGIEMKYGVGKRTDSSPSLDRIDNSKGYVYNNVCVISWRANNIKSDGTAEELRKVADYMSNANV